MCANFNLRQFFVLLLSAVLLCNCKKSNNNIGNGDNGVPTPAPMGTTLETGTSQVVGRNGGSVISSDGLVELVFPTDALAADTTIKIQHITNTCPGGLYAYRFEPEGIKFNQPVTIKFHYPDSILNETLSDLMGIAYQDTAHYWRWVDNISNDTSNKTLSATITHFSDWAAFDIISITPSSANLKINNSIKLAVTIVGVRDQDNILFPITKPISWSANGVVNGNTAQGNIVGVDNSSVNYIAPESVPSKNPVTVTAEVNIAIKYNGKTFNKTLVKAYMNIVLQSYIVEITYESTLAPRSLIQYSIKDRGSYLIQLNNANGTVSNIRNQRADLELISNTSGCSVEADTISKGPIDIGSFLGTQINPSSNTVFVNFNFNNVTMPSFKMDCHDGGPPTYSGGGIMTAISGTVQFQMVNTIQVLPQQSAGGTTITTTITPVQ